MYNRYIRNDQGTYTRIAEEDGPPVPPSGGVPLHGGELPHGEDGEAGGPPPGGPPHGGPQSGGPPHGSPQPGSPPVGGPPPAGPPKGSPSRRPAHTGPGGGLRKLLDDARMDRIDDGDLLLLGLLFFLAREGADEELLTALGLLLIL